MLLYLIDRGVVERQNAAGRRLYLPTEDAELWILSQPALAPYVEPALELVEAVALRHRVASGLAARPERLSSWRPGVVSGPAGRRRQ